jgi:hypothetical protein
MPDTKRVIRRKSYGFTPLVNAFVAGMSIGQMG